MYQLLRGTSEVVPLVKRVVLLTKKVVLLTTPYRKPLSAPVLSHLRQARYPWREVAGKPLANKAFRRRKHQRRGIYLERSLPDYSDIRQQEPVYVVSKTLQVWMMSPALHDTVSKGSPS
jgi:hypothetical protein